MSIVYALRKYGHDNFGVLIIEYTDLDIIIIRETHWISALQPYYNVLKQGYSSVGYKHTKAVKEMLSELAKNKVHSKETKALIAQVMIGENNPFYNKKHTFESKLKMIKVNSYYPVYIYNSLKQLQMRYPSVKTLAKLIGSNSPTIVNYINNDSLFRGGWYFSRIPFNISDKSLITDYSTEKGNEILVEMKNNSHIRKAVFVFNLKNYYVGLMDWS